MSGTNGSGRATIRTLALVALAATLAVSCIRPTGPGDLKRQLGAEAGVKLDRQVGVTVTRSGIWLARKIMNHADADVPDLRGLRRVEVGVYEVTSLRRGFDRPRPLGHDLFPDWDLLASVRDDDADVRVLIRERDGRIRKMLVVVAERDEWVLVRMSGKLERILESAMQLAFDEADRPDLYAEARDEARATRTERRPARDEACWEVSAVRDAY